ncbi:TIGR03016 family PEP-CTERM system-associated outer membrane protein [Nitrosococcus wardiae]|uniref:TIGR03016 family PEP-CTERM system-associated outer membrane protein n=1 Tax=Nitrosococcus wardiae TaxID=1814290 RepID=A0A4P7BYQ5_9GAMM|nr:TIGR03016 family PEP-CTERM system-associated outer membrane protein [Nitrosococcus wardiae]QBQ54477.1 TIGR03016 family PEP-CTERM system-associated outer membrane protein [Nitrosococcus wardiae]
MSYLVRELPTVIITMAIAESLWARRRLKLGSLLVMVVCGFYLPGSKGAEWIFTPRGSVATIYTDNIFLAPADEEESEFVVQITPGFLLQGIGSRFDLDLNYQAQNLFFVRESGRSTTFNQLQSQATAELYENLFFVDARSTISQQIISARDRVTTGNLPITGNRSDVITFGVSPYLRNDFAGYAETELRYTFDTVRIERGASDSLSHRVNFDINSGERFTRLRWNGQYRRQQINRSNGDEALFSRGSDVRFERAFGLVGYQLTDEYSLLAEAGYTNNDFRSRRNIRNGFFWAVGLEWRPSRYFSAEALYGPRNKRARITFSPHARVSMELNWRERDVGLNPGTVFNGFLRYRRRHSSWEARYFETTNTIQQLLTEQQVFAREDPLTGEPIIGPGGEPILVDPDIFSLTDEVLVRKRFQLTQTYTKGRTSLRFSAFKEEREFGETLRTQDGFGGNATWTWRFAKRMRSNLRLFAQNIEFSEDDRSDLFWSLQASLTRDLSRQMQGAVIFQHSERESTQGGREFQENRVTAQVTYTF